MNARSASQDKRFGLSAALLLACLAAGMAAVGCVNVQVDADELAREYGRVLDRVMAERIAIDTAREEGIRVENYELDSQQREKGWWVSFEAVAPAEGSQPAHFTVRVSNDGKAKLFRED